MSKEVCLKINIVKDVGVGKRVEDGCGMISWWVAFAVISS